MCSDKGVKIFLLFTYLYIMTYIIIRNYCFSLFVRFMGIFTGIIEKLYVIFMYFRL